MNSLICFLTGFHVFKLIQNRLFVPKITRRLIYLGMFLPLGDYILRFILGEFWFYSGNLIFHSFFFQASFWSIIALLYWVYTRDLPATFRFYFPLLGLVVYMVFSFFGTEHLAFWSPFSSRSFHLDWINSGFLVPMTVAVLLRLTKRWSEFSSITIARISLSVLVFFLAIVGVIRYNAQSDIPEEYKNLEMVNILPANNLQTEWEVVSYRAGIYHAGRYHFVQGFPEAFEQVDAYDDYDAAQTILLDPAIRKLILYGFNNPQVKIEIQNEVLKISINELRPLAGLLWIKQALVTCNRSGMITDLRVHYGTFL
jgi:hypothetical protein